MGFADLALGYAAGALSTLSPCVLPLLPVLLASAVQSHVLAPVALAAGLSASFTGMGILAATLGLALDASALRPVGATLLLAFGIVLLVPRLQDALTLLTSPLTAGAGRLVGRLPAGGVGAQLLLGLLLGIVWAPCAGPTLGAAIGLAAQRDTMLQAATVMAAFGLGAATPLLTLAYGSRQVVSTRRDRLKRLSAAARPVLGVAICAVGVLILAGLDKRVETYLTNVMPDWLLNLTTQS